jgi:hypothetical protein
MRGEQRNKDQKILQPMLRTQGAQILRSKGATICKGAIELRDSGREYCDSDVGRSIIGAFPADGDTTRARKASIDTDNSLTSMTGLDMVGFPRAPLRQQLVSATTVFSFPNTAFHSQQLA